MLYYFYLFGRRLVLRTPIEVCYKVAVFLADIYYRFARVDKINLRYNLRIVLPGECEKNIEDHIKNVFRNFAKYLIDFLNFSKVNKEFIAKYVILEGRENLDKTMAHGKGTIFLTAHIGNWELGGAVVATLGYPFYAIALSHKDKRINDFFLEQRAACGEKVIPIGAQLRSCFKVLKNNGTLAVVGDRDFSNHGVPAVFFGKPTILPKGAAVFSLRTLAPIVPTFVIRTKDDKFRMYFLDPIYPKRTDNEELDIKLVMENYIAVMEKFIRQHPDQWYAYRKVWSE
ncbi:MAG: lysophospholipid acyltransferase family protein [Candidatus Omnitrophota bacterium]